MIGAAAAIFVGISGWMIARWRSGPGSPTEVAARRSAPPTPAAQPLPDLASAKSLAVLAFANLSDDKGNEYFSDGISEELLKVLSKVPGLKVTARTSSFHFKGMNTAIPEIAQQLGVAYVVEGSVRKAGSQVRITAQLIKAADGFHVWSDTFTRELKDVFALQDEIAGLIAKNLSLKLGASSAASTATVNPQAFELYVQARQGWNLWTPAGFDLAEKLLNRALALEPNFARAHAALADVWLQRLDPVRTASAVEDQTWLTEKARIMAKINQALALDPDSAEAHASLGTALRADGKQTEAESALRRALALDPNYASARQWLGRVLLDLGQMDEALEHLKLATELDPLSPIIWNNYGIGLSHAGRTAEGFIAFDRAFTLEPNSFQMLQSKSRALVDLGRITEVVALVRSLPSDNEQNRFLQISVFARAGLKAEAEARFAAGFSDDANGSRRNVLSLFALGRTDEAMARMIQKKRSPLLPGGLPLEPNLRPGAKRSALGEAHSRRRADRSPRPRAGVARGASAGETGREVTGADDPDGRVPQNEPAHSPGARGCMFR